MKQGLFNLELLNRETGEVFQEHTKEEAKTFAEVEPDAEYSVRVSSQASDDVYADIIIDGRHIEKGRRVKCQTSEKVGIWKRDGCHLEENAFRFDKADVKKRNETSNTSFPFWTGVVTAMFYGDPKYRISNSAVCQDSASQTNGSDSSESQTDRSHASCKDSYSSSVRTTYLPRERRVYTDVNDNVSGNVGYFHGDDEKHKKGVKTVRGKTTLSRCSSKRKNVNLSPPKRKKNSIEAVFLGSIKLNYCSTIGLIHAEILPEPPGWRYMRHRATHPRNDSWKDLSDAKVEKIHIECVKLGGIVVQESKVVELFDLTK